MQVLTTEGRGGIPQTPPLEGRRLAMPTSVSGWTWICHYHPYRGFKQLGESPSALTTPQSPRLPRGSSMSGHTQDTGQKQL